MAALNKVMLIGNCGREPEIRYIQGGAKVAQFTLAVSEKYKDRNGDPHENTEWFNIVVWNKPAEFVEKYVQKGVSLYIDGKLRTRSYEANGEKKYVTEVVADRIQLLGKKEEARPSTPAPQVDDDDDDCPF